MSVRSSTLSMTLFAVLIMGATAAHADFVTSPGAIGPNATVIDFDNIPLGTAPPIVSGIATFTFSGDPATVQNVPSVLAAPVAGVQGRFLGFGVTSFFINFSQPVAQVGLAISDPNFAGDVFRVLDANGVVLESNTSPSPTFPLLPANTPNNAIFLGVVRASADIRRLEILNTPGEFLGIDNVRFSVVPVPEPSSLVLLSSGMSALLGCYARRKRAGSRTLAA